MLFLVRNVQSRPATDMKVIVEMSVASYVRRSETSLNIKITTTCIVFIPMTTCSRGSGSHRRLSFVVCEIVYRHVQVADCQNERG